MMLHKIHSHFESNSFTNGGGNEPPSSILITGGDGEEPPHSTSQNIQVQDYQFKSTYEFDIPVIIGIILLFCVLRKNI